MVVFEDVAEVWQNNSKLAGKDYGSMCLVSRVVRMAMHKCRISLCRRQIFEDIPLFSEQSVAPVITNINLQKVDMQSKEFNEFVQHNGKYLLRLSVREARMLPLSEQILFRSCSVLQKLELDVFPAAGITDAFEKVFFLALLPDSVRELRLEFIHVPGLVLVVKFPKCLKKLTVRSAVLFGNDKFDFNQPVDLPESLTSLCLIDVPILFKIPSSIRDIECWCTGLESSCPEGFDKRRCYTIDRLVFPEGIQKIDLRGKHLLEKEPTLHIPASCTSLEIADYDHIRIVEFANGNTNLPSIEINEMGTLDQLRLPTRVESLDLFNVSVDELVFPEFVKYIWLSDVRIRNRSKRKLRIPASCERLDIEDMAHIEGLEFCGTSIDGINLSCLPSLKSVEVPLLVRYLRMYHLPALEKIEIPGRVFCASISRLENLTEFQLPEDMISCGLSTMPSLEILHVPKCAPPLVHMYVADFQNDVDNVNDDNMSCRCAKQSGKKLVKAFHVWDVPSLRMIVVEPGGPTVPPVEDIVNMYSESYDGEWPVMTDESFIKVDIPTNGEEKQFRNIPTPQQKSEGAEITHGCRDDATTVVTRVEDCESNTLGADKKLENTCFPFCADLFSFLR